MSKVVIGEQSLAEMTTGQRAAAAPSCSEADLADIGEPDHQRHTFIELAADQQSNYDSGQLRFSPQEPVAKDKNTKPRFGLPQGFVSRLNRYGRTVLFEDNVYRLPNGGEFIPQPPTGTLGSRNHRYALLTPEQYEKQERGSVYVKADGRIFNYAFDHGVPEREIFDTGFTIQDLERTGQYAPELKRKALVLPNGKKKKRVRRKRRKLVQA